MINDNLTIIRKRITAAALRAGRSPSDIKLVAVSKRVPVAGISEAIACGHFTFGENYVQEAMEKIPRIKAAENNTGISFHFIGKLQTNKAGKAAEIFDVIETIDSAKLACALERHLGVLNRVMTAYIQVNVGQEKQKNGVSALECQQLLQELPHFENLKITGLMTMPPYFPDPEMVRPCFRHLRELSVQLASQGLLGRHGPVELSMGMSGDFEIAIEEGATEIRIGTAIFGRR